MGEHRLETGPRRPGRGARRTLTAALVLVVAAGLGIGVARAAPPLLARTGLAEWLGSPPVEPPVVPPRLRLGPLAADGPVPTGAGLARVLDWPARARELGTLTGVVLDPATGRTLWSRAPASAQVPGSTGKLLTAAAALLALDPATRLTTKVVAGSTPDAVVLVGGGDPTLSGLPGGAESVYPGAAKLDALAEAVRARHPGPVRSVTVDLSRYRGPGLAPGWLPADVAAGYVAPIESLSLDGGRSKPAERDPPRTATPGLDTGRALARRLGAEPARVRAQPASAAAPVLGQVDSPSVTELVQTSLRISDNVLAEALAREVALARGEEPTFTGAARAVLATLAAAGLDVDQAKIVDGSGLSTADRIPARLLSEVMAAAAAPSTAAVPQGAGSAQFDRRPAEPAEPAATPPTPARGERAVRLRPLLAGLPVAGGDGTLDDRFGVGPSAAGRGYVRAKTGTLTGVSSLAGTVVDADGRLLVFALISNGTSPAVSRPRLDAIAAALRTCGCR